MTGPATCAGDVYANLIPMGNMWGGLSTIGLLRANITPTGEVSADELG